MIDCYTTDPDLLHEALNAQDVEIEFLTQQLAAKDALLRQARNALADNIIGKSGRTVHTHEAIAAIDKELGKK